MSSPEVRALWHPRRRRRALWKRLIGLRFRLLDERRYRTTQLETIAGQPLLVLSGVFNPKIFWSGEFMADSLLARHEAPE